MDTKTQAIINSLAQQLANANASIALQAGEIAELNHKILEFTKNSETKKAKIV